MMNRELDSALRQAVVSAVHYALYLPNIRKIHEEYTKREINHEN